jgi:hypothetical protein
MLYVQVDSAGFLECGEIGACGSPIVGRGASVLEAVGEYAIQTRLVGIKCSPPEILEKHYRLKPNQAVQLEGPQMR